VRVADERGEKGLSTPFNPRDVIPANSLTAEQPKVDERIACDVGVNFYGLKTLRATLMAGERDKNFLLESADGGRWILKFYNETETELVRDFQQAALLHLARHDAPPVPRLIPTRDGPNEFVLSVNGANQYGILISYIEGIALGQAAMTPKLKREIGRSCARLDQVLAAFRHPAARRPLLWDLMQLDDLQPTVGLIDDARRRRWIGGFVERFLGEVRPGLAQCRPQTIHNDINTNNLLIATRPPGVSGIIDFGDMVHAPLVNDIGIAASYVARTPGELFDVIAELTSGFEEVTPLTEQEAGYLFDIVVARLVVRVLIYQWRSVLFPDNTDYILRNSAPAWAMVEAVMLLARDEGKARVLKNWRNGAARPTN
jgi:Ser/Thr protein kinase RdoA (MazF antagonist)